MPDIAFITEAQLKTNSNIDINVNIQGKLTNTIQDTQLLDMQPFIGYAWYTELQSQLSTSSVTAANQTFLDRLIKPMSAYVEWRFIPQTWAKIREQGLVNMNGQNATNTAIQDMEVFMRLSKEKADALLHQLECWLYENRADYPLWPKAGYIQTNPSVPFSFVGKYDHCQPRSTGCDSCNS